jgi:hypothetical protein
VVEQFVLRSINLLLLFGIWKELIIVPIYKKGDKRDCNNYRGISFLLTTYTYKTLSSILLSRLTPYAKEIIGDHQYGFLCNKSTTEHSSNT